jgi:hypothetical protein
MAAVATKKPGGGLGVQLTFPRTFMRFYEMSAKGLSYFPTETSYPMPIMMGDTFQNNYHSQKQADANQSVMNGIQNKLSAERKLLTGVHNFHLPKPVLGQRVYANPSVGATELQSARRGNSAPEAPFKLVESGSGNYSMMGGAVTVEGRDFYNARLQNRIEELNRMNALAQGYTVPSGQPFSVSDNTRQGSNSKVDFFTYLRSLQDAIVQGDYSKFTFENLKDTLKLLFQFAPTATREDFNDIIPTLDLLTYSIREATSNDPEFVSAASDAAYVETLSIYLESMRQYVTNMLENVYMSPQERLTLSNSLIKGLGFMNFMTKSNDRQILAKAALGNQRVNQAVQNLNDTFNPSLGMDNGNFSTIQRTREDTEQDGVPRQPLAGVGDPNQAAYGRDRGSFQNVGYFGEANTQRPSDIVAPLTYSGVDQTAIAEPVDGTKLKDAVDSVVEDLLAGIGGGGSIDDIINANYQSPDTFVEEVASALEQRGFTPAEIARGMEQTPIQAFAGYITKNKGDIAPKRLQSTQRPPEMPTIMYQPQGAAPPAPPAAPPKAHTKAPTKLPPGFPSTREKLREDYRTVASLRQLASTLPSEWGVYTPRADSLVKNVQAKIINIVKEHVNGY